MAGGRTYEEDMDYWLGNPGQDRSPMLSHLSDIEILGLGDSYDDGRIDTLISAYIKLRKELIEMRRMP